jgi:protein gp37
MADTKIEWTRNPDDSKGKSWNSLRARRKDTGKVGWYCQKKSPGCAHCYAERNNLRVNAAGKGIGNGALYTPAPLAIIEPFLDEKTLLEPLHWRKPTTVFVCSMTDLFGSWVKDEWIDRIYAVEALCPQHTFIHVTKRPERRLQWMTALLKAGNEWSQKINKPFTPSDVLILRWMHWTMNRGPAFPYHPWPLPNVRELVTVCNQEEADALIPILLDTPAACRGVSIEPMLGPVTVEKHIRCPKCGYTARDASFQMDHHLCSEPTPRRLDWVICGGETGPGARPMHPDWARSLRDQCAAAAVPFFFKQWGEFAPARLQHVEGCVNHTNGRYHFEFDPLCKGEMKRLGKRSAGCLLDGREWKQFPEVAHAS